MDDRAYWLGLELIGGAVGWQLQRIFVPSPQTSRIITGLAVILGSILIIVGAFEHA